MTERVRGLFHGAALLSIGTVASGVLAYVFNLVAARALGPEDYGPVAVLWATMFLVSVVLFRPVELTLSHGLAERLALNRDGRPVVRSAARMALFLTAAVGVAAALAWGPLTDELFSGQPELTAALVFGIAGYALSYFIRGLASGLRWFGSYGVLLFVDGAARVALAVPLIFVASPTIAAAAMAGAALSGALAPIVARIWRMRGSGLPATPRLRPSKVPVRSFARVRTFNFAAPVAVIAASEQVLVSGGALLIALTEGAGATTAAGTVFAATMLVRAPVFLFQGVAAALLPNLTRLSALGDDASFRRQVVRVAAVMVATSAVLVAGALAIGPEIMRLLFGAGFDFGRIELAILSAGVGTYLVGATLAQAGLARDRAGPCAVAWAVGAAVFVVVVLLLPSDPFSRVSVAFTVSTGLVAVWLSWILVRQEEDAVVAAPKARADRAQQQAPGPVLLVCSSGGHLLQLLELRHAWEPFPRLWVAFDKADTRSLLTGERVIHAHGPTNRNIPNLLRNLRLARSVIKRERPSAILTTGAGVAVPFAWIGRLHGVPTVYVESFTRIEQLSLSARLISPVASRLYVQWPELAGNTPRMHFAGNLFVNS